MNIRLVVILFTVIPFNLFASDAKTAYESMRQLQGDWFLAETQEGKATQHKLVKPLLGTRTTAMSFKTLGKGSTVQEDLLPTTKKHMATMYHCEGSGCQQLRATHYCAKQNQPRMLANLKDTTGTKLVLDCDMSTTLCQSREDHVHRITHELSQSGRHLRTSYATWRDGKYVKSSVYHFTKK